MAAPLQDALVAAGPQAAQIIDLWRLVVGVCSAVFAAVLVVFLLALWRAPRSDARTPPDLDEVGAPAWRPHRRIRAVITLAASACALLLVGLIAASWLTDRALWRLPMDDALRVQITAHQWWWEIRYDDDDASRIITTANELVIPVGRPVQLQLKADDVIHSFWVPSLHGKMDLIPGREAQIRLRADQPGSYRGQCAEFCGAQHARMALTVQALPPADYAAWAAGQRQVPALPTDAELQRGRQVFLESSCVMCHALQGTPAAARRAPDLTHVGSRRMLAAGSLPNTREHLERWISDPQQFKPGTQMPATPMTPERLRLLARYLESLK